MPIKVILRLPMNVNTFRYLSKDLQILSVFESIISYKDNGLTDVSITNDPDYRFPDSVTFLRMLRNYFFRLGFLFQRIKRSSSRFLVTLPRDIGIVSVLSKIIAFLMIYPGLAISPIYFLDYSIKGSKLRWFIQEFPALVKTFGRCLVTPAVISMSIMNFLVSLHQKISPLFVSLCCKAPLSRVLFLNCYAQPQSSVIILN